MPHQPGRRAVIEMSRERFEELVGEALDQVPEELTRLIDNCVVLVEDDPPGEDPELLGLYEGIPITERDSGYVMKVPDRITIFRNPTFTMCQSEDEVVDEVGITVV